MKQKKTKVSKIPKAGTCKRIEWELKRQGAFSRDTEDGAVPGGRVSAGLGSDRRAEPE